MIDKYWVQRYNLFSRFGEGIQLDEEGWYSVTPEHIAVKHAGRCRGKLVINCFAGVAGNSIQFAHLCPSVVAIDIDPQKIALAKNNARIYGVEDLIDFIVGDFFQLAPSLKMYCVFPPWGGPTYNAVKRYKMELLRPRDGYSLFQIAQSIARYVIMFLPRNVDLHQVEELCWLSSPPLPIEIEENYVGSKWKAVTAYFGGNLSY